MTVSIARWQLCLPRDTGDTYRPAARLLIQFFAYGGGLDRARAQEGAQLF
ncbi:hypothetical protein ACIREE_37450 [Streptomyces sp. NPDC102467]